MQGPRGVLAFHRAFGWPQSRSFINHGHLQAALAVPGTPITAATLWWSGIGNGADGKCVKHRREHPALCGVAEGIGGVSACVFLLIVSGVLRKQKERKRAVSGKNR